MAISLPELAIAIEAKWTEPRYQIVGKWLRDSANRKEVLRGWCELLEQRGANPILEGDLRGLPYQMVHRAASACHVKDASSCWLVYLVFEPTARKRSEYLADLTHLRDVLGSRSSLGIALAECSIEQSRSLIELRRRWDNCEHHLHVPVLQRAEEGWSATRSTGTGALPDRLKHDPTIRPAAWQVFCRTVLEAAGSRRLSANPDG